MQHITYGSNTKFPVAILVKEFLLTGQQDKLKTHYVDPLVTRGIPLKDIIVIGLPYTSFTKCTAATINKALPQLQNFMDTCGCQHVLVADTPYLKKLARKQNLANLAGVLLPSTAGSQRLFKGRLYTTYAFNDKAAERVNLSLDALAKSYAGTYIDKKILHEAHYPHEPAEIKKWLNKLLKYDVLAVDIEGFGLRLDNAGVATIAFSWDAHSGVAFGVDYREDFQKPKPNWCVRQLLREFFIAYANKKGITLYHNVSYDVKQLVCNLFMKNDLLDYRAMVDGVQLLTENAHCTKDISYLATNSAAGNTLGLKHLALEFTDPYAIDIKDVTTHPLATVLEYNLKDTCATFWLYKKNYPIMVARNQEKLYLDHYQPNQRMLITVELTGMPLNMKEVIRLRLELNKKEKELLKRLRNTTAVKEWTKHKGIQMHEAYQESVKGPGHPLAYFLQWKADKLLFKPTQDQALVWILHEYFKLPVIDKTTITKSPSVSDDTLKKHLQWIQTSNKPAVTQFLEDVREYLKITKINGTFIKAFITKSIRKRNGIYYLHGGLNQGGTLSGRLSSNDPNLQNLPSGGYWGKAIKKCFIPPPGYTMLGSDYAALEARIAAMRTNDPIMRKVFTDGFDSHSLNTYAYADGTEPWYSKIKDPSNPADINLIKNIATAQRRVDKTTTFALQFLGTHITLMNNQGYSEEKSKRMEKAYHDLYKVYFSEIKKITDQAVIDGYITVAYGLRIDAPAIAKTAHKTKKPAAAKAEIRSISNAICQSYGQMNTFAATDFMHRVWDSKWRYSIHIQALIHDAIYLFVPSDIECIAWVNQNLIECMCMQTEANIKDSDVSLEADLEIYFPSWAEPHEVPNNITKKELKQFIKVLPNQ